MTELNRSKITIRQGTPADAATLAELAATTFREAFAGDNRPEDIAIYMARAYGAPQQAAELANPTITSLLALVDHRLAGYAQLRSGDPAPCVGAASSVELWRFYVAQSWHGRGLAQILMSAVIEAAKTRGAHTLWLGVWERNERAQAFYRKTGFRDVGAQVFVLGTDEQADRVMALTLSRVGDLSR